MRIQNWDHLKTISAVARTGSYRSAAKELNLSNTTVARHVESVEEQIGDIIFTLRNGRWLLTDVGKQLEKVANETIAMLGSIDQDPTNEKEFSGHISITTISFIASFFLAKHCQTWKAHHPSSVLEIESSDKDRSIETGQADIALRLSRPTQIGISRFKVATCPMGVFGPHEASLSEWIGLPTSLDKLPEMELGRRIFGCEPSIRLDSFPAIASAALTTKLPGILPTCLGKNYPGLGRLKYPEIEDYIIRELWFLYHDRRVSDPGIRAAIDWIKGIFPRSNGCLCGSCFSGGDLI